MLPIVLTTRFPIGTVVVNVAGCFVIGLLAGLLASDRIALRAHWREFVFVGLLGGFTTFSTFGLDTFETRLPLATRAWHCLPMAGIDTLWTAGLVATALALAGHVGLFRVSVLLGSVLGAATAILVEWFALQRGLWTYNELMPLVPLVRVGWWPVLQMSILPPIAMTITRRISCRT